MLTPPPEHLTATRDSLRSLACYVISPARKQRTGRIGLRPTGDGFGTPPFDDGARVVVRGDRLIVEADDDERSVAITTVRAAAAFLDLELWVDPGVGHDLPPYEPDVDLNVDSPSSQWLGRWYAFGAGQLDRLRPTVDGATVSEAQLWPEHFDLAVTVGADGDAVNVGFSPGDHATADRNVPGPGQDGCQHRGRRAARTRLVGGRYHRAGLLGASLSDVHLAGASLFNADLTGGADLASVALTRAVLADANLTAPTSYEDGRTSE